MKQELVGWLGLTILIATTVLAVAIDALRSEPNPESSRPARTATRRLRFATVMLAAAMAAALVATAIRLAQAV